MDWWKVKVFWFNKNHEMSTTPTTLLEGTHTPGRLTIFFRGEGGGNKLVRAREAHWYFISPSLANNVPPPWNFIQIGHLYIQNITNWGWEVGNVLPNFDFLYLYINSTIVCFLFVSNKRQNGWTDRAQILCRTLRDPGKVY